MVIWAGSERVSITSEVTRERLAKNWFYIRDRDTAKTIRKIIIGNIPTQITLNRVIVGQVYKV